VLRVKLRHLDSYNAARRSAADSYDAAFANHPGILTPVRARYAEHVFHQYTLRLQGVDRDAVHASLASQGIPSMIYYPVPCHKQEMLAGLIDGTPELPVTDQLNTEVISLPMHTELTEEELSRITTAVLQTIKTYSRQPAAA
jgi:dTDP-4-amino-4,6-dideoxygalactose transaminase